MILLSINQIDNFWGNQAQKDIHHYYLEFTSDISTKKRGKTEDLEPMEICDQAIANNKGKLSSLNLGHFYVFCDTLVVFGEIEVHPKSRVRDYYRFHFEVIDP